MKISPIKTIALVQTNSFQVPPGLAFGPNLPLVKLKKVKTTRKTTRRKAMTKSERERARKAQKLERKKKREAKLHRRAKRREEDEQLRAERGETLVAKAKPKRDPKSHHGTESVDTTILKLLGKTRKSKKVAGKGKNRVVDKKKVQTEEGTVGAKWKPGMRSEAREGCTVGQNTPFGGNENPPSILMYLGHF